MKGFKMGKCNLLVVVAVFDSVGKRFGLPQYFENVESAIRAFKLQVNNNKDSVLHFNSSDFTLHFLGSYNQLTGELSPDKKKGVLISGLSAKE